MQIQLDPVPTAGTRRVNAGRSRTPVNSCVAHPNPSHFSSVGATDLLLVHQQMHASGCYFVYLERPSDCWTEKFCLKGNSQKKRGNCETDQHSDSHCEKWKRLHKKVAGSPFGNSLEGFISMVQNGGGCLHLPNILGQAITHAGKGFQSHY